MAKIIFRLPTDEDVYQLGVQLRQSDLDEIEVSCRLAPHEAVLQSVLASDPEFLWAVYADDVLLGIGGCSFHGHPWLLGTDALADYQFSLGRYARKKLKLMRAKYPLLSNLIDVRQSSTRKWLACLGFVETKVVELVEGFPLVVFVLGDGHV